MTLQQWLFARWHKLFGIGRMQTSRNSSSSSPTKLQDEASKAAMSESKAAKWTPDPRSARNLDTLEPQTRRLVTELLRRCLADGMTFKVTSGTRTFSEQDALYAQGRTKAGDIVTNAKAGSSWHNYALAADLTLFDPSGKKPIWDGIEYDRMGRIAKELGLEWGGDWKRFKDRPHVQRNIGKSLAQAKAAGLGIA